MRVTLRPRHLVLIVSAGLVLTAAAGGVGYAAGSSGKNVSACVNSKGRLALQNKKGKCPKHFSKVAIAKQGPRGATGARGPGALAIRFDSNSDGSGTPRVVGGIKYTPACSPDTAEGTFASVAITAPSGATATLRGVEVTGSTTSSVEFSGSPSVFIRAHGEGSNEFVSVLGALVMVGQTMQTVSMSVYAYDVPPAGKPRCSIRGTITPAG